MDSSRGARTAVIVGAGVAGLTVATALARKGWRVDVAEIDPRGATAGWGLCLTGPSLRALDALGMAGACLAEGSGMNVITHVDVNGQITDEVRLPRLLGAHRPAMVGIARPGLHRILSEEAERSGAVVRNGLTVTAVDEEGDLVRVRFSDGTVRTTTLVVGADGIRSSVRSLVGLTERISLGGIADAAQCSPRTISSAFREGFGLPPLAYVRNLRLARIRADILTSTDPVGVIAYRWGITHLGRFAGEYRDRFGELPSATAARR
ncbi:FAD-dependent monooxygenase [Streptomyces sp. NEAU-YJ-81]|uniref:FAD-dependent monooxygenase n=1 Tax=Streptomyces sp. NEAU-YJ-81 TaxID=2820288 RepID=UPI001FBA2E38|nr:FAD-dependent monooxygenase [Streptomyces sp. NEAU-YJ-81]